MARAFRRESWLSRAWGRFVTWLFSAVPRVSRYEFTPEVLASMRSFSLQTHPKEAIGLLQGERVDDVLVISSVVFQPFANTTHSATIQIDPTLTGIVGTFHSHPGGDSRTSAQDRRLFSEHAGVHVIVPEPYRVAFAYDTRAHLLGTHRITSDQGGARGGWRVRRENR